MDREPKPRIDLESTINTPKESRMTRERWKNAIGKYGVPLALICTTTIGALLMSSPAGTALASIVWPPTPVPGSETVAATVIELSNKYSSRTINTTIELTSTVDSTFGSVFQRVTVPSCGVVNVYVQQLAAVPEGWKGAGTVKADVEEGDPHFASVIPGYTYRKPLPTPTNQERARRLDTDGDGEITAGDVQFRAGRFSLTICDDKYTAAADGFPFRDGVVGGNDVQEPSGLWGQTYPLSLGTSLNRTLSSLNNSSPKVDVSIKFSSDTIRAGDVLTATILADDLKNLGSEDVVVEFDGTMLSPLNTEPNPQISQTGRVMSRTGSKYTNDSVHVGYISNGLLPAGVDGENEVLDIMFRAKNTSGSTEIKVAGAHFNDVLGNPLEVGNKTGAWVEIVSDSTPTATATSTPVWTIEPSPTSNATATATAITRNYPYTNMAPIAQKNARR